MSKVVANPGNAQGRRIRLWALLLASLLPLLAVLLEIAIGDLFLERVFSFSHFLSMYWFAIALSLWLLVLPLATIHALFDASMAVWKQLLWVAAFWTFGPISVPAYCVANLIAIRNRAHTAAAGKG